MERADWDRFVLGHTAGIPFHRLPDPLHPDNYRGFWSEWYHIFCDLGISREEIEEAGRRLRRNPPSYPLDHLPRLRDIAHSIHVLAVTGRDLASRRAGVARVQPCDAPAAMEAWAALPSEERDALLDWAAREHPGLARFRLFLIPIAREEMIRRAAVSAVQDPLSTHFEDDLSWPLPSYRSPDQASGSRRPSTPTRSAVRGR